VEGEREEVEETCLTWPARGDSVVLRKNRCLSIPGRKGTVPSRNVRRKEGNAREGEPSGVSSRAIGQKNRFVRKRRTNSLSSPDLSGKREIEESQNGIEKTKVVYSQEEIPTDREKQGKPSGTDPRCGERMDVLIWERGYARLEKGGGEKQRELTSV